MAVTLGALEEGTITSLSPIPFTQILLKQSREPKEYCNLFLHVKKHLPIFSWLFNQVALVVIELLFKDLNHEQKGKCEIAMITTVLSNNKPRSLPGKRQSIRIDSMHECGD